MLYNLANEVAATCGKQTSGCAIREYSNGWEEDSRVGIEILIADRDVLQE